MPVTIERTENADVAVEISPAATELRKEYDELEKMFTVSKDKLIEITNHFISELDRGLSNNESDIPMNPTWVFGWPNGKEKGQYLALDMGGTNVRVVEVTLDGSRGFSLEQEKFEMDSSMKYATADELFGFLADCVKIFVKKHHKGDVTDELALGFTFSFPCTQISLTKAILQRWTKGFDVKHVEDQDVVELLNEGLKSRGLNVTVTALINDTTGTLIASNYKNPRIRMGCIFGTGVNAAYMEHAKFIPKIEDEHLPPEREIAINCEYGAFDNSRAVLPLTKYDVIIDEQSPRPGQQIYEKMISGLYLGELLRLTIQDMFRQKVILKGQDLEKKLDEQYLITAKVLGMIELDTTAKLEQIDSLFKDQYGINLDIEERKFVLKVTRLIGVRSARLSHTGIAAVMKKKDINDCDVGADGSVFNKYPRFAQRGAEALKEILGEEWGSKIKVTLAEDGSGAGAAIIAAMSAEQSNLTSTA